MKEERGPRIAILIPFAAKGQYWPPLLAELARRFPGTTVFSCMKSEVPLPYQGAYAHRFAGAARHVSVFPGPTGPGLSMTLLPLGIFGMLLRFRPQVIFTSGFSTWSVLSLVLGALRGSRVVILYDGSSPGVDLARRSFRIALRRVMARRADAFMTNSRAGATYLARTLRAAGYKVFRRPYLVPSSEALSAFDERPVEGLRRPVFLFIGRVSYRKGFPALLEACAALARRGRRDFSLLVVGAGPEREKWRERADRLGLGGVVRWAGQVDYGRLGAWISSSDVLVFPSLTDVWGMAVLEAMAFARPVICSRRAGASEIVEEGHGGFLFDPHRPEELAAIMERFIAEPELARELGARARQILTRLDPPAAAEAFEEVVRFVTSENRFPGNSIRSHTRHRSCRSR